MSQPFRPRLGPFRSDRGRRGLRSRALAAGSRRSSRPTGRGR